MCIIVSLYPLYIFLVLLLTILPSFNEYEKRDISLFNVSISSFPFTSIVAYSFRELYSFSISTNLPSPKSTGVSPRTHLPLPKGPGIAAVPPFATGKKVSRTLWPVTRGVSGGSFLLYGLGILTVHLVDKYKSTFPSLVDTEPIGSLMV